jgi:HEAT repeat protein
VIETMLAAPADRREPYRAAMRVAADRAVEPLLARLTDERYEIVATAAEFLGLTGSPAVIEPLLGLIRHRGEVVRERALLALAELGGRDTSRPCMPALKDESALVRLAAARAIGVMGDPAASTVLVRRLDLEPDEGVQAEILRAVGRLGAPEALEVLAKWAEAGGRPRRTAFVRAAAIEALGRLPKSEARALIELYRQDKDPAVKRAADAVLR